MSIVSVLVLFLMFVGTPITVYSIYHYGTISNEIIFLAAVVYGIYVTTRISKANKRKRHERLRQQHLRRYF